MRPALQHMIVALRWFFSLRRMSADLMMLAYRGAPIYRTANGKWKAHPRALGQSSVHQARRDGTIRYFPPRRKELL